MNMEVHAEYYSLRGNIWFDALTQNFIPVESGIQSLRIADGEIEGQSLRVFCIVPDQQNSYPRACHGEVGLLEGWSLAKNVNDVIELDRDTSDKRGILCIVDVPSQAYGRREESLGIHQALAGAVDSYVRARLAGHPVVSLLVGKSMSGAFLAHGYQANRILALKDPEVMVHAMGKASAARVTLRSIEELEKLAANIPPMAYDIDSFNSLGLLSAILEVNDADQPVIQDIQNVQNAVADAFDDIKQQALTDLKHRLNEGHRKLSKQVRQRLREQWS
ncbi:biotin-independent malonate decarboxylase subunit gamma [Acinetobacter qingfengensis]|uniref:Biotin-independent malonate decarboxylase subunit gamma n=1 Tax=Acinetobacter qingfengensis TaxID=1262585 RepID=A0A1E7R627_9GAMM|nr:biotin-independent malonate decarboxylase subunit gamma [Acinetobacter qingfengensis]KAA8734864.1 biotin-independent malonate decarboxylase subunit gamma [Acinetobacter qingfengensis]OEY94784.1 biotin-independent malonate decarboxylase subunit gamma [Acinetobacter qingfengensis]